MQDNGSKMNIIKAKETKLEPLKAETDSFFSTKIFTELELQCILCYINQAYIRQPHLLT